MKEKHDMAYFPNQKTIFKKDNINRFLLYCCIPALLFYCVSLTVMSQAGFTLVEILRDPAQQTKQSSFLGFVSNIGTWLWLAAATICFFRAATYKPEKRDEYKTLLILSGCFSLFLAIDDFFLIHDRYITEGILIPLYAIFVGYLLKRFHKMIFKIDGFAFMIAGTLLAMSVLVDAVQEILPISYGASQALEEGFKFVGAAAWLYFCFRIAAYQPTNEAADPE